jgi:hypothetical protein
MGGDPILALGAHRDALLRPLGGGYALLSVVARRFFCVSAVVRGNAPVRSSLGAEVEHDAVQRGRRLLRHVDCFT